MNLPTRIGLGIFLVMITYAVLSIGEKLGALNESQHVVYIILMNVANLFIIIGDITKKKGEQ